MKISLKAILALILVSMFVASPMSAFAAKPNYSLSEIGLVVGVNTCAIDSESNYTVVGFEPETTGKFTITASNAKIGIASLNGLWVMIEPSAETVNETQIVHDFTSVGQKILLAIKCDDATASITVAYEELIIIELPWTSYQNKVTPEKFYFGDDIDNYDFVDTEDDVCDEAVLGSDGYYHLNSANGAILYAALNDEFVSLYEAWGYGGLRYVIYDEDGEAVEKIDYSDAFMEYYSKADSETSFYPLTEDLMTMLKNIGIFANWFGEDGYAGGTLDDAWMFLCYYDTTYKAPVEGPIKGDVNGSGDIDAGDYGLAKRYVLGTFNLTDEQIARGDLNANGDIDANDYALIKRHVLGTYVIK